LLSGKSDQAVMAIEKLYSGAYYTNYALIDKMTTYNRRTLFKIHQNLMALKGAKVEEHNRGTFHPMALLQCMDFLKSIKYKVG
jgi:prephenate dehydratase